MMDSKETKLHLVKDAKSYSGTVYGRKGDEVFLISEHDDICIVQNALGNRFSVPLESLSVNIVKPSKAAPEDAAAIAKHKTKKASASRKKEESENQQSLF